MKKYVEIFEKFEKAFDNMPIKKKKVDQDADGDTDFIDAKVAQYQKGGMTKGQAIAKAKQFAKKNNIKDSNKSVKEGLFNRFMKPSIDQASDDSVKGHQLNVLPLPRQLSGSRPPSLHCLDRKSTRLNSSHFVGWQKSRMPSSA